MKYTFLFFLIFALQPLISQESKDLSENDTLYYYFKHKKNEHRSPLRPYNSRGTMTKTFRVDINSRRHFFKYVSHKTVGEGEKIIPILTKNHRFLKENNGKILCYSSLKRMGSDELEELYWKSQNRVVYLIDKKENKNGEILLRRVFWSSGYLMKQ